MFNVKTYLIQWNIGLRKDFFALCQVQSEFSTCKTRPEGLMLMKHHIAPMVICLKQEKRETG